MRKLMLLFVVLSFVLASCQPARSTEDTQQFAMATSMPTAIPTSVPTLQPTMETKSTWAMWENCGVTYAEVLLGKSQTETSMDGKVVGSWEDFYMPLNHWDADGTYESWMLYVFGNQPAQLPKHDIWGNSFVAVITTSANITATLPDPETSYVQVYNEFGYLGDVKNGVWKTAGYCQAPKATLKWADPQHWTTIGSFTFSIPTDRPFVGTEYFSGVSLTPDQLETLRFQIYTQGSDENPKIVAGNSSYVSVKVGLAEDGKSANLNLCRSSDWDKCLLSTGIQLPLNTEIVAKNTGRPYSPEYGRFVITVVNGQLVVLFPKWDSYKVAASSPDDPLSVYFNVVEVPSSGVSLDAAVAEMDKAFDTVYKSCSVSGSFSTEYAGRFSYMHAYQNGDGNLNDCVFAIEMALAIYR